MARMTLEEMPELVRRRGSDDDASPEFHNLPRAPSGAGFVPGIARLSIHDVNQTDAGQGVNSLEASADVAARRVRP